VGLVAAGLLSACRVDLTVLVEADELGAGRIDVRAVLDRASAAAVLPPAVAPLAPGAAPVTTTTVVPRIRLDDLRRAGWDGPGLVRRADGTALFTLGHRFTTVQEANTLLAQLSGPDGPFAGLRLRRTRSPWSTSVTLEGAGDFSAGLGSFGDAAMATTTGGGPFGIVDAEVLRQAGATKLGDVFDLRLEGNVIGRSSSWTLTPGRPTPVRLAAQSLSWATIAGTGGAVAALVAFVALRRSARTAPDEAAPDGTVSDEVVP
jgi:hypothetical protein